MNNELTDAQVLAKDPNESQKLTEWKNEPSLAALTYDMEQATGAHQAQMTKIQLWNDLMTVSGKAKPTTVKGRSSVQPKLIRRQAEWRYSALTEPFLGTNKLYKVSPATFEDAKAARQNELLLNWQFRTKINRVNLVDDFVRSTVDEGTCVLRVGWSRKTVKVKQDAPVFAYFQPDEQQFELLKQALEMKQADPRSYDEQANEEIKASVDYYEETGQLLAAQQTGTEQVDVEKVLFNHPTLEVMNPDNVVIDPSCSGDILKAKFAVVKFETCKADLEAETGRYKNLDKVDWKNGMVPLSDKEFATKTPTDFVFKDEPRKKVVAYEYWGFYDIHGKGELTPIVASWVNGTLIRMEENPFPDQQLPFVLSKYLPVKRELYGEPDAELLEDNQKILGAVTRGMIDLLGRSANSQVGLAKGMLDPLNRRRYDNGQDYEFNPTVNPQGGLVEHKFPELPQSAMLMLNLQNQEAESLTGVKSFGGGISGEAYGDVAAGIRGVLDASSKREMAILRRLAKAITDAGVKIIKMNSVFLSDVEVVRVTNQEFVEVQREDLKGDFDLEVDISTAEVDDAKAKDLGFVLQTLGPKADPKMVYDILGEICALKRMPELADRLKKWQPPEPSPEQVQIQQLEIQKLQLENAKTQSEIELNQAKAKQATALADKTDLGFVEQETGTTHAREMEKQKAQAEGNQNLAVTKALTTPLKKDTKAPDLAAAIGFNQLSDRLNDAGTVKNSIARDQAAQVNPQLSLGSGQFDPAQDPALNPAINF